MEKMRWWDQRRNRVAIIVAAATLLGLVFILWPTEFYNTEAKVGLVITTLAGAGTAAGVIQGIVKWTRGKPVPQAHASKSSAGHGNSRPTPSGPDFQSTMVIDPPYARGTAFRPLPAQPSPRGRRLSARLAGFIVICTALAISAAFLFSNGNGHKNQTPSTFATVPAVGGEPFTAAERTLTADHLTYQVKEDPGSTLPEGAVDHLSPGSGVTVKRNFRVTIYVSGSGIDVPTVVYLPVISAIQELLGDGFKYKLYYEQAPTPVISPGEVWSQNPAAETPQPQGATVTLFAQPQ